MKKEESYPYARIKRSIQHAYLKEEGIEKYVAMHASPYPEIVRTLKRGSICNYTVWLWENELYDYWEAIPDSGIPQICVSEIEEERVVERAAWDRWRAQIRPCFLGHQEGVYYDTLSELAHIDGERSFAVYRAADEMKGSVVKRRVLCARLRAEKREAFCRLAGGDLTPLSDALCAHHVGNLSVSLLGDDVYVYFEYGGDAYEDDMARLLENENLAAWKRAAEDCMLVREDGGLYKEFQEIFCCE